MERLPAHGRGLAAWRACDVADPAVWTEELSAEVLADLDRAEGDETPALEDAADRWRAALEYGVGFRLLRGLRFHDMDEARRRYWRLGCALGAPTAQNPRGDVLGDVFDTGAKADDVMVRKYQTRDRIAFHVDGANYVGLLCVRGGVVGGVSRIASSAAIYDAITSEDPVLARALFDLVPVDRRNEERPGDPAWYQLPIVRRDRDRLAFFFHSDYFRSAHRHGDAPPWSAAQRAAIDTFEALAESSEFCLGMDLEPGDIQLLNNSTIVHARAEYDDRGGPPRHLLRLWLNRL